MRLTLGQIIAHVVAGKVSSWLLVWMAGRHWLWWWRQCSSGKPSSVHATPGSWCDRCNFQAGLGGSQNEEQKTLATFSFSRQVAWGSERGLWWANVTQQSSAGPSLQRFKFQVLWDFWSPAPAPQCSSDRAPPLAPPRTEKQEGGSFPRRRK